MTQVACTSDYAEQVVSAGERKIATILFADIVDSSRVVAGNDPEEANKLLLSSLQGMIECVHRFGGTVCQVLGDGIMAVFGVPHAAEDHAVRACLAADDMRQMVRWPCGTQRCRYSQGRALRIGLCSGEIAAYPMKPGAYPEFRVVGEAVHLAARMERTAKPGAVVLAESTRRLLSGRAHLTFVGELRLSRAAGTVRAYELTELRIDDTSTADAVHVGSRAFIGRRTALATLQQALDNALLGLGRVLLVTGDAGIGKSRLVAEFLSAAPHAAFQAVECRLSQISAMKPLGPLAQIIKSLVPIDDALSTEQVRRVVSMGLLAYSVGRPLALPAVLDVLGVEPNDRSWSDLDPPERHSVAIETVGQVVLAASRARPMILALDDCHWAGSEVWALAQYLARHCSTHRILVVLTCRNRLDIEWRATLDVAECRLRPLTRRQSCQLLDGLIGADPGLGTFKDLLVRRTEGNPFFIEECVKALVDEAALVGDPGAYRLARPVAGFRLPASVRATLASRIDRLEPDDRRSLLGAAVVGQTFDVGVLRDLLGTTRQHLLAQLARLRHLGFVERTRLMPTVEFTFRHALIHEVAYETLLKTDRRELHARVLASVERQRSRRLVNRAELLAHHANSAQIWPKAYLYCRAAGRLAQGRSRNTEAINLLETALDALGRLPPSRRNRERSIDLRIELAQCLCSVGRAREVWDRLSEAKRAAKALGDLRRRGRVSACMVVYHWMNGRLVAAVRTGREALLIARRANDFECEIQSCTRLGSLHLDLGNYAEACHVSRSVESRIPERINDRRFGLLVAPSVGCRAVLARCLAELGCFDEAIEVGDECLTRADDLGHAFSVIHACVYVGQVLLRKGDFTQSIPILERGLALCRTVHGRLLLPMSASALGYAKVLAGHGGQGLAALELAVKHPTEDPMTAHLALGSIWLAEAYLHLGRPEKAVHPALQALDCGVRNGERGHEGWALRALGEAYTGIAESTGASAEACFLKAWDIATALGMKPLAARCHFGLAKHYRRVRARHEATARFEAALQTFRELGMDYWATESEAALAQDDRLSDQRAVQDGNNVLAGH